MKSPKQNHIIPDFDSIERKHVQVSVYGGESDF